MFNFRRKTEAADPEQDAALEARLASVKAKASAASTPHRFDGADRSAARKKIKKIGEIFLADGKTASCLVTDVSATGMKLYLYEEEAALPDSFRLRVPTLEIDLTVYFRWREERDVGVSFRPPAEAPVEAEAPGLPEV